MSTEEKTVQVWFHAESEKSIGVLVELRFDESGHNYAANRLEWFPKSICTLEKKDVEGGIPVYFLKAPEWILKNKKVNYECYEK